MHDGPGDALRLTSSHSLLLQPIQLNQPAEAAADCALLDRLCASERPPYSSGVFSAV